MKKVFLILVLFALPVLAEEITTSQNIDNEKSNVSINFNSQIQPNTPIEKQKIKNRGSWFNININRNTYKMYCKIEEDTFVEKKDE